MHRAAHPPFRTAAVLGAGVMGSQIAAHLANAGLSVHLLDLPGDGKNRNAIVEGALKGLERVNPAPLFTEETVRRIIPGNIEDDFHRTSEADWIIEAVVEKPRVKQQMMARVEAAANNRAVISTNTSGIPIHLIAQDRSPDFRSRFLGTHFFNPPRYLKLLELIPLPETDPAVVERISGFGRVRLGKGIVIANDTPGFIGNRIGVYAMMQCIRAFTEGGYTIEEIDALTGPLLGRPRSATFRTADVVGLDTLAHVAEYLYRALPEDESRDRFQVPAPVAQLVEDGATGAKAGRGFYKKEGRDILSFNPVTGAYEPAREPELGDLKPIRSQRELSRRLRDLYAQRGRAGDFFREHLLDTLGYSTRRIPEITTNPADIDRALRWGFGWEVGPFEMWDIIGFDKILADMKSEKTALPEWIETMAGSGAGGFRDRSRVYLPDRGYVRESGSTDEFTAPAVRSEKQHVHWQNEEAALLDLGDDIAHFEYRSKANSMGETLVRGLIDAVDVVEAGNFRGMVICNTGKNFSVGANLGEMVAHAERKRFDLMDRLLVNFQQMIQRVHYAAKPVVVATHGRVLGGGCELTMACASPVAAAESYIGLVELAVGLIPGGCGTMRMAAISHERASSDHDSHIQPFLTRAFETVAMAKVSNSAHQAREYGFLAAGSPIVMNQDLRLQAARQEVLRLSVQGYAPPPVRNAIRVLGQPARARFEVTTHNMLRSGFISEYDRFLANRFAYVLTGGDLTGPANVHEDYLLELEREVFVALTGEQKTRERIHSILRTNRPLRN
ncbi:MAG: 3-hydroxyacyl-CoA dehydrogenase NAD-binding domain-containing protein [Gemmatimonadetes bacterium]|nr:3-hydroxyacyl-CoA dehydrogenase NAD-binding domain-containing protein [Gemmatimonadota bacterium]